MMGTVNITSVGCPPNGASSARRTPSVTAVIPVAQRQAPARAAAEDPTFGFEGGGERKQAERSRRRFVGGNRVPADVFGRDCEERDMFPRGSSPPRGVARSATGRRIGSVHASPPPRDRMCVNMELFGERPSPCTSRRLAGQPRRKAGPFPLVRVPRLETAFL